MSLRVLYTELDHHPEEGDHCTYLGEPFTGIAYGEYTSGVLNVEWRFEDGTTAGTQRRWYANGNLSSDYFVLDGQAHGLSRGWGRDGWLSCVEIFERGRAVRTKRWDNKGVQTEDSHGRGLSVEREAVLTRAAAFDSSGLPELYRPKLEDWLPASSLE